MRNWGNAILGVYLAAFACHAQSATLHVPADFGTIQCAIDAAAEGDEIVVAPGIYFENLAFDLDRNFTLRSTQPDAAAVVLSTIVDGRRNNAVILIEGQQSETLVSGFTLQRGQSPFGGGAVSGENSEAVIRDNIMRWNTCIPAEGVSCNGAAVHSGRMTLENNVIVENESLSGEFCSGDDCMDLTGRGGALGFVRGMTIRNIIARNKAPAGGQALHSCSGDIRNNLIVDHAGTALHSCGGVIENNEIARNGMGLQSADGMIARNFIHSNGSHAVDNTMTNASVRKGNFFGNFIFANDGWGLSGIDNAASNVFVGNRFAAIRHAVRVTNNLIVSTGEAAFFRVNEAIYHNTVYNIPLGVVMCPDADIANNIFWNIDNPEGVAPAGHQLRYNIVQDHDHGDGTNVVADPMFVDGANLDFRLQAGSPAIDGGVFLAGVTEDILGTARGVDGGGSGGDGSNYDMGAVEFVAALKGEAGSDGDAFFAALAAGEPPPGVGILDPPTWPDWVWQPHVAMPEDVVFPAVYHHADQDQNGLISLSELLRVIQFFNSDGYRCQPGTEDGWAPGPNDSGDTCCKRHNADYNPPDYSISLSELLRVIQHFNVALPLYLCGHSEDGFCGQAATEAMTLFAAGSGV